MLSSSVHSEELSSHYISHSCMVELYKVYVGKMIMGRFSFQLSLYALHRHNLLRVTSVEKISLSRTYFM